MLVSNYPYASKCEELFTIYSCHMQVAFSLSRHVLMHDAFQAWRCPTYLAGSRAPPPGA